MTNNGFAGFRCRVYRDSSPDGRKPRFSLAQFLPNHSDGPDVREIGILEPIIGVVRRVLAQQRRTMGSVKVGTAQPGRIEPVLEPSAHSTVKPRKPLEEEREDGVLVATGPPRQCDDRAVLSIALLRASAGLPRDTGWFARRERLLGPLRAPYVYVGLALTVSGGWATVRLACPPSLPLPCLALCLAY